MFAVLFSLGPVEVRTMTIFILLAFFLASFILWRKGREEHYSEAELFDGFLISTLVGSLVARIVFVLFNFQSFGFTLLTWFNLKDYPGINLIAGLVVAALYMYKIALKHKWDQFEILDFWVTSVSIGLGVYYLGTFFDGTGYGYATTLPWGVVFPQLVEPHHPVQMYFVLFYLLLYFYLSKVEYSYRTFTWYRHGKKTAQTGFLTSVFLIAVGTFTLLMSLLKPATMEFFGVNIDVVISFLTVFLGVSILYSRSGRTLPIFTRKKFRPVRTKLENLNE